MDMVQVSKVWKVFTAVLFGKGFVWLASRRIPLYYSPQAQIGASKGRRTCAMSMQLELPLTVICLTLRISLASQKWVLFLKLLPFVPLCRFPDSVRTASGAMRQHRARRRQMLREWRANHLRTVQNLGTSRGFTANCCTYTLIPVVPGQAGGGSFQKEKNYIAQKEFA